jgi:SAM-dependent methyltransferase
MLDETTLTALHARHEDDAEVYFSGRRLYGDDFGPDQLRQWYEDEKEGFAALPRSDSSGPAYLYHRLNAVTAYCHLPADRVFADVLGVGSAFGEEFKPLRARIKNLVILDPSEKFVRSAVYGVPVSYVKPDVSGAMPFADESFDLITCFGALHHIANVSFVLAEMCRVLRPGGYALVREPITSMGDWRADRSGKGLTRRERGIPRRLFNEMVARAGFSVCRSQLMDFPALTRLARKLGVEVFNHGALTGLDLALCRLFSFNTKYHRASAVEKLGPAAVAYVLSKAGREVAPGRRGERA